MNAIACKNIRRRNRRRSRRLGPGVFCAGDEWSDQIRQRKKPRLRPGFFFAGIRKII